MAPRAVQYRPHDNCDEVGRFLWLDLNCTGVGESSEPWALEIDGRPVDVFPGDVLVRLEDNQLVHVPAEVAEAVVRAWTGAP